MNCVFRRVSSFCDSRNIISQVAKASTQSNIGRVALENLSGSSLSLRAMSTSSQEGSGQRGSVLESGHDLIIELEGVIRNDYAIHPFRRGVDRQNLEKVLGAYFAMSQAFPYIQAGAYRDLILSCINTNQEVPEDMDGSFVVGAFLSFDETGGNFHLRTNGIKALPEILNTKDLFHAALLKKDIKSLIGVELKPNYSGATRDYLLNLMIDLGSADPVKRCATMVAFEMHAGEMIEALWDSLERLYPEVDKDSLEYFRVHVGGDDPQEEYHKLLTKRMLSRFVSSTDREELLKKFNVSYRTHFQWCAEICH